ncbi:hypothetical protein LOK49_Contig259G00001 [Camellia lanceoleosa]|nr:hypothetical protein LOK49_Contig259G00001 [Camellia lanceoleosa]
MYCGILSTYCLLLLLQRSLSVPSWNHYCLLIDGHHYCSVFKTYCLLLC